MEQVMGNIFCRLTPLPTKGNKTVSHKHNFDHVTYVPRGSVRVTATLPNGETIVRDFGAGTNGGYKFLVRADVMHSIEALEDDTLYECIYAHRTAQGDIVQDFTGWPDSYC